MTVDQISGFEIATANSNELPSPDGAWVVAPSNTSEATDPTLA